MAIGMQKLADMSEYEYLTQQVAVMDATERVHGSLGSPVETSQTSSPRAGPTVADIRSRMPLYPASSRIVSILTASEHDQRAPHTSQRRVRPW